MKNRTCKICNVILTIENAGLYNGHGKYGPYIKSYCKECDKIRVLKYQKEHPEIHRKNCANYYKNQSMRFIIISLSRCFLGI
jgi:RNase P subunit RPR2